MIHFSTNSLAFTSTLPSATVLTGSDEALLRLAPAAWPTPTEATLTNFLGSARTRTWRWELPHGFNLELIQTELIAQPGITLRASITNRSTAAVRLRSLHLVDGGRMVRTSRGCEAGEWTITPLRGQVEDAAQSWHEARMSKNDRTTLIWKSYGMPIPFPLPTDEKSTDGRWRKTIDGLGVVRAGGREALIMQAVGPGEVEFSFDYHVTAERLALEIAAVFCDVLLEPCETRTTDELLVLPGGWQEASETAFRWVASTHGARLSPAPVGWCSWYDLMHQVTARSTQETAERFRQVGTRLKLGFFQLDDGHQRTVGDWRSNPRPGKFPGGYAPFVHDAASIGARPGIWVAPLAVHESSPLFTDHPEWMQKDASGKFVAEVNNWGPVARWMDPTHPGAQQWIRGVIRELRAQGFTYFKIDFNTVDERTRWHNSKKTRLQVFRDLYRLYREELGEENYLLCCGAFTLRAPAGFADALRIGPDAGSVWEWGEYPCSLSNCVRAVVQTASAHAILYVNDPDVTYLRPRDTVVEHERRSWHGFVGLSGGLVSVSEPMGRSDFVDATPMLQMLIPPVPERGRSLHGGADPLGRLFGFTARRVHGDCAVVQLHNPDTSGRDVALSITDTELTGPVHVWSFWDGRYRGTAETMVVLRDLPPRGSEIIRLTPLSADRPVIIGSDLHISCGVTEISRVDWDDTSNRLTISLDPDAGRDYGAIWVATPWAVEPLPLPSAVVALENLDATLVALGGYAHVLHIRQRMAGRIQKICLALPRPKTASP